MKMIIFVYSFVCITICLLAENSFKSYLNLETDNPNEKCSTKSLYDANTAVTFFGDSRIDLVDMPLYGAASLDFYLLASGWNTQNFGKSAMESHELKDLIQICFKRGSTPPEPAYPNFKIAYNVAFEIGGNDYFKHIPFFIFNPALYITRVPQTRDNIASVIYTLQKRERNVLLIGNYSAVSWSVRLGDPKDYAEFDTGKFWNPKTLEAYSIAVKKDVYKEAREFVAKIIAKIMITSRFLPETWSILTSFVDAVYGSENSELNKIYKDGIKIVQTLQNAGGSNLSLGSYTWWKYVSSKVLTTSTAFGIVFLENELRAMYNNPSAYGLEPFHYVSTLEVFFLSFCKV